MIDTVLRPRRSVLYMPSSNERALEKAKTIPTDALILDLEDAVAPDAKDEARTRAVTAAGSGAYGRREITIRCNGLDTPWGSQDLAAVATSGADAVVVPKVDSVDYLDRVAAALDDGGAPDTMAIWAMVETPTAIFDVRTLAAHPRVAVLVMGTNDLVKELRAVPGAGRSTLTPYLATVVLAAREAGKAVLDGVYNNVRDADGFRAEARQGFEMGFDGKTLVHPSQVEPVNEIWAPSEADVDHARRVVDAFAEAEADRRGVVTVDGRMVENLHRDNALRILATADAIAALEGD